jgi:hypothetical protein
MTTKTATKPWTRATTVANTLADRFGLEKWSKRTVLLGIAARPDLYALAASCTPDDKSKLNEIVENAEEAGKARSGANLGSALHTWTQRLDQGEELDVPQPWRGDIDAYYQTLVDNRVSIDQRYIERVVVHREWGIAGTFDRIVEIDGTHYIADVKTGSIDYGVNEIAVQLAIYANATHLWKHSAEEADNHRDRYGRYLLPDPANFPGEYEAMPEVDRTRALIIHLPVEQARCELVWVDIEAGYEATRQALWVREWRKRRDLSAPYMTQKEAVTADDDW